MLIGSIKPLHLTWKVFCLRVGAKNHSLVPKFHFNQHKKAAKARLPTFSHNPHLAAHYILLTLNNIDQITTCRLFDSIQFCICLIPRNAPHFFVSTSAIPDNRCLTEWVLSVKTRLLTDKLLILNNLSVKPHLFTDNLSILSQLFTVIGSWWRAGQPRTEKKLNIHADSPKLVKPSSGIDRGELRGFHG